MDLFQSILANIKKNLDRETGKTEAIAKIVSSVLGMTVTPDMVVRKGKDITLKLAPTARMKLTLKRQAVLLALKEEHIDVVSIR